HPCPACRLQCEPPARPWAGERAAMSDRLRAVYHLGRSSQGGGMFEALIDELAAAIAAAVIAKIEDYLSQREPAVQPDAYRIDEAAQALGLSLRETKRLIASGELGSRKVGRARLIPRQAISDFLNGRGASAV